MGQDAISEVFQPRTESPKPPQCLGACPTIWCSETRLALSARNKSAWSYTQSWDGLECSAELVVSLWRLHYLEGSGSTRRLF